MRKAFTLAEVLITLGIIGIVSAMTIPTLITKSKRMVLKNQFKESYSVLAQAVKMLEYDEEGNFYGIYYDDTDKKGEDLRKAFYKNMSGSIESRKWKEMKEYTTSAKGSKQKAHYCPVSCCVHPATNSFVTNKGAIYRICARDNSISISFDINGYNKGPNKWGIDLFDVDYDSDKGLHTHYKNKSWCSAYNNSKQTNANDGMSCTHFAISDSDYFNKIDI